MFEAIVEIAVEKRQDPESHRHKKVTLNRFLFLNKQPDR